MIRRRLSNVNILDDTRSDHTWIPIRRRIYLKKKTELLIASGYSPTFVFSRRKKKKSKENSSVFVKKISIERQPAVSGKLRAADHFWASYDSEASHLLYLYSQLKQKLQQASCNSQHRVSHYYSQWPPAAASATTRHTTRSGAVAAWWRTAWYARRPEKVKTYNVPSFRKFIH